MSYGSDIESSGSLVEFRRFAGCDINLSYDPFRWMLDWPTYIAMVFPHPNPDWFIESLIKPPNLEGASYRGVEVDNQLFAVVSLLFDGLITQRGQKWLITNPRYPTLGIPIPDYSDIFLADSKTVSPDSTLACLAKVLRSEPPSALI